MSCENCERCTWNPGPDCGRADHPHCPHCGHCCGRHAPARLFELGEFVVGHDDSGYVTITATHLEGKLTPESAHRIAAALQEQAQVAEFIGSIDGAS